MILTCENCLRRYSVAEEMLRGKALRLRCKGCQHIIVVPASAQPQPGARRGATPKNGVPWHGLAAVASPVEPGSRWLAIIAGRQAGPFGLKELGERQKSGEIGRRTYVWRPGMAEWKRAEELSELSALFAGKMVTGDGEAQAHHLRESFEQPPSGSTESRPLPGLKLSPNLVAAAPLPAQEAEKQVVPNPTPEPTALSATPGDETRFFIAKAGMHKRNPPWKVAAFAASLIALPAAVLYLLAAFKIGPLVVTRIDASGNEIRESVFAEDGVSGLGDLLSGRQRRAKPHESRAARPAGKPVPAPPKASDAPGPTAQRPSGSADLRAFYAEGTKADVGPAVHKQRERAEESGAGLAPAEVAKVVAQTQPAFQFCIEQEMKKNPSFKGGKIFLNALVGGSGTVKQVAINRPDIDGSTLGECLKGKAKRMVFAAYSGDDTEVQIPLILTTSL